MKLLSLVALLILFSVSASAQSGTKLSPLPDLSKPVLVVDAACGKCIFGMKAQACTLAVKIKGKTYFVDGTGIDDYGDAHGKQGFCNASCKAEVQGEIRGGRFKATYFKLLPADPKTN